MQIIDFFTCLRLEFWIIVTDRLSNMIQDCLIFSFGSGSNMSKTVIRHIQWKRKTPAYNVSLETLHGNLRCYLLGSLVAFLLSPFSLLFSFPSILGSSLVHVIYFFCMASTSQNPRSHVLTNLLENRQSEGVRKYVDLGSTGFVARLLYKLYC